LIQEPFASGGRQSRAESVTGFLRLRPNIIQFGEARALDEAGKVIALLVSAYPEIKESEPTFIIIRPVGGS